MARKGKREALSPDLTPLIDVVFLLLIFFMVSSVFKKEELALLLNLPKTQEGKSSSSKNEQLTIELSQDQIAVNGKNVSMEDVSAKLSGMNKKTLINLRVDGTVVYKRLVTILDLLQKNKLENINLITEKSKT